MLTKELISVIVTMTQEEDQRVQVSRKLVPKNVQDVVQWSEYQSNNVVHAITYLHLRVCYCLTHQLLLLMNLNLFAIDSHLNLKE